MNTSIKLIYKTCFFQRAEQDNSHDEDSSSLFSVANQANGQSPNNKQTNEKDGGPHCKLHFVPSGFFNFESGG